MVTKILYHKKAQSEKEKQNVDFLEYINFISILVHWERIHLSPCSRTRCFESRRNYVIVLSSNEINKTNMAIKAITNNDLIIIIVSKNKTKNVSL